MTTVTMNGNGSRRAELAAFLRSRRERITPEQVGLAPGLRRRTPGLRREEVAQLAGVGVTWYTWLEQGRQINASAQVLGAVAQTLRLDPTERQHLYRLADVADGAARPGLAGSACEQVPADVQGIIDGLVPLPASVMNERYDLLGWNEAYAVLWPGVVGAQPGERNILWQNFTYPDCCHPYVTRHEQLARLVAQFRSNYGRHVGEPAWTGFISALQAASPHFARLWEAHDVASPVT
jgi:transcriptional regulator with XRE-family HTH domain